MIKIYYYEEETPMFIFLTNTEQLEKMYIACIVLGITSCVCAQQHLPRKLVERNWNILYYDFIKQ